MQVSLSFWAVVIILTLLPKQQKLNHSQAEYNFPRYFELSSLFSEKLSKMQKNWTPPKRNTSFHVIFGVISVVAQVLEGERIAVRTQASDVF